ncbi:MAG: ABC transporter substrate-binding protein, partial [Chloroflexota bacterium]|nr:ABC transporter substrate-binding protein [Chloroflexota bacterium]
TYTFALRDDLFWSDGAPITSADYKWTFEQLLKPENQYPYISNLEPIASYEAPDPKTIVVKLKEPVVVGLETADAVTPLPKHIWETLDWSDPQRNPQIMAPTVASGPYVLQEWRKDDRAVFVANERYYDGKPLIETFTYRIVPSNEIAFQMLKTGEVDFSGFAPDNYEEAKTLPNATVYEWWPAAASWLYIGFNFRREPWQDPQVRHALAHAIDRDGIAQYIQLGLAEPTYSVFPPSSWVYNPDVPKYQYDMEQAKALLDQAGWKPGPNGIRQKDGKPLTLKILYGPPTSKTFERVAQVAQQSWTDLGIQVEVQTREWGTYLNELKSEPFDWDVNLGAWSATIEPHFMQQIWLESSIPQLNAGAYVNKRVEELFEQGVREFDREKRKQIYGEIQRIMAEESPYIFLTYSKSYIGVNNRIGGIEPTSLGIGWNRERWFVK